MGSGPTTLSVKQLVPFNLSHRAELSLRRTQSVVHFCPWPASSYHCPWKPTNCSITPWLCKLTSSKTCSFPCSEQAILAVHSPVVCQVTAPWLCLVPALSKLPALPLLSSVGSLLSWVCYLPSSAYTSIPLPSSTCTYVLQVNGIVLCLMTAPVFIIYPQWPSAAS